MRLQSSSTAFMVQKSQKKFIFPLFLKEWNLPEWVAFPWPPFTGKPGIIGAQLIVPPFPVIVYVIILCPLCNWSRYSKGVNSCCWGHPAKSQRYYVGKTTHWYTMVWQAQVQARNQDFIAWLVPSLLQFGSHQWIQGYLREAFCWFFGKYLC